MTVTFNSTRTLRDTIESVLAQSYPNIEHVVIDGGSSDGTVELLRELESRYGGRLKWTSEPDYGIYDAMNKGVALASGDIVGILNSDDLYASTGAVAQVVDAFNTSKCDAVYADLVYVDREDTQKITRTWIAGEGDYLKGWSPPHPTLYVSKQLYEKVGEYRRDYKIASDYDFMLRAFLIGSACAIYLNDVIVKMRRGGESTRSFASNRLGFTEAQNSLRELGVKNPTLVNILRVLRKVRQFAAR